MKKLYCLFILVAASFWGLSAQPSELQAFTVRGEIEGLVPGDTLLFERVTVPGWKRNFAFQVIVEEPNRFSYTGEQTYSQHFLITYHPVDGNVVRSDRSGLEVIAQSGITSLRGTREKFDYSTREGGVYADPYLRDVLHLEDSLGMARGELFRLYDEYKAAGDTVNMQAITKKSENFYDQNNDALERLSILGQDFYEHSTSSEYGLIRLLSSVYSQGLDRTTARFSRFTPEAQNSHYGKLLQEAIAKRERLRAGNDAPDFQVAAIDGTPLKRSDYTGRYLLIYHWGLCPGSVSIDKEVQDLYRKYKSYGFEVIGVTADIEGLRKYEPEISPTEEMYGIPLKSTVQGMLAHPWPDVDTEMGNNKRLHEDYAIAGLPFFIFISPEGKLLARAYSAGFEKARQTLAEAFPEADSTE